MRIEQNSKVIMDASSADNKPDYLNPDMPVKRRTEDILSRMSLEEKVAQMVCVWNDAPKTLIDEK